MSKDSTFVMNVTFKQPMLNYYGMNQHDAFLSFRDEVEELLPDGPYNRLQDKGGTLLNRMVGGAAKNVTKRG